MPMLQLSDYIRINQRLEERVRELEQALALVVSAENMRSENGRVVEIHIKLWDYEWMKTLVRDGQ